MKETPIMFMKNKKTRNRLRGDSHYLGENKRAYPAITHYVYEKRGE
jgi:hypothetical protein